MVLLTPPRSGVLTWMTSAAWVSVNADVFHRVAPLVDDDLDRRAPFPQRGPQLSHRFHLGLAAARVHRLFHSQPERCRQFPEPAQVVRHPRGVHAEREPDRAVRVEVQHRRVVFACPQRQDPVADPAQVRLEQFALGSFQVE